MKRMYTCPLHEKCELDKRLRCGYKQNTQPKRESSLITRLASFLSCVSQKAAGRKWPAHACTRGEHVNPLLLCKYTHTYISPTLTRLRHQHITQSKTSLTSLNLYGLFQSVIHRGWWSSGLSVTWCSGNWLFFLSMHVNIFNFIKKTQLKITIRICVSSDTHTKISSCAC